MTAEVAILNRQGIALAADSAVTVTGPYGQKIFNTVNKLFMLSKYHPVGIMVYSNAEVMGVPVESVIKVFRQKLGTQSFVTLEEYRDAFITFLTENTMAFPEQARGEHAQSVIFTVFNRLRKNIFETLIKKYPGAKEPSETEIKQEALVALNLVALKELARKYSQKEELTGVTDDIRKKINATAKPVVDFFKKDFHNRFYLTATETRIMQSLGVAILSRSFPNDTETGFVIAGFGRDEMFPQLRSFLFETSLFGITKMFEGQSADASKSPAIVPFAQTEMMETFVEGRARRFDSYLERFIAEHFEGTKQNFSEHPEAKDFHTLLDAVHERLIREFR